MPTEAGLEVLWAMPIGRWVTTKEVQAGRPPRITGRVLHRLLADGYVEHRYVGATHNEIYVDLKARGVKLPARFTQKALSVWKRIR